MRLALQVLSVVVSLLAAWLWWRASQQPPPTSFELRFSGEMDQGFQGWVRSSARANSWAARCTAAAVVLQAASGFRY
jgi:hypothetical protein